MKIAKQQLLDNLSQFTGTTQYYRVLPTFVVTDGVKYLMDEAECYWLADAERVGTLWPHQDEGQESNWAWAEAHEVKQPFEEVFYRAIDEGLATTYSIPS